MIDKSTANKLASKILESKLLARGIQRIKPMPTVNMRILLFEPDLKIRKAITSILRRTLGADVVSPSDFSDTLLRMEQGLYDLFVCDQNAFQKSGPGAEKLLSKVKTPPFLVTYFGDVEAVPPIEHPNFMAVVSKNKLPIEIPKIFESTLKTYLSQKSDTQDFVSIDIEIIKEFGTLPCELFIRLPDRRFLKIFHENDEFSAAEYKKYRFKKVKCFYIRSVDVESLLQTYLSAQIFQKDIGQSDLKVALSQSVLNASNEASRCKLIHLKNVYQISQKQDANLGTQVQVSASVQDLIHRSYRHFGISKNAQDLVRSNVKLAISSVKDWQAPEIAPHMRRLTHEKESYMSKKSLLLAFLTQIIAQKLGYSSLWARQKLCMAAIVHDITVPDQRMAHIKDLPEFIMCQEKYDESTLAKFENHPLTASKILKGIAGVPADVHLIVAQHHECPDGFGFPKRLGDEELHLLSRVFILAHDLSDYMMRHGFESGIAAFFSDQKEIYRTKNFNELFGALKEAA